MKLRAKCSAPMCRQIRSDLVDRVRRLAAHPATLLFALGNEIPAPVVRWHGTDRIERFVQELYEEAKSAAPEALLTYVNYPPSKRSWNTAKSRRRPRNSPCPASADHWLASMVTNA